MKTVVEFKKYKILHVLLNICITFMNLIKGEMTDLGNYRTILVCLRKKMFFCLDIGACESDKKEHFV